MARTHIVAVDIGTNSVKILQVGLTQTGLVILNSGLMKYPRQSAGEKVSDEVIVNSLAQLIKDRGFKMKHVALSYPRHLVTVKDLSGLPASVTDEDINKMVPLQIEPELPFSISEAVYSIYNLQRAPEGVSLEVVATKETSVRRYVNIAERAGIKLGFIIPSAFATYGIVFDQFREQLAGKNIVSADIGAGGTDICIIQHGRLSFSRSFTYGGNNLTQMFEREHGLSFEDAEAKKIETASLRPAEEERLTLRWAENMVTQIAQSIRAFTGKEASGSIDSMMLCGGGSLIPGLDSYLSDKLGIEVTLWDPLQGVERHFAGEEAGSYGRGLSVCLGLAIIAMAGTERTPTVNVNLLPKELIERALRIRKKITMSIAAAAAVLVLASAGWGLTRWQGHKRELYESIEKQLKTLEQEEVTIHARTALEKSILMEKMMVPYVTPLEILREMSEKLPGREKIALTSLSIDKNGKVTMSVEAASHADIGEMLQILSEMKFLDKVNLFSEITHGAVSKATKENRPIFQVQIICTLNQEATQEVSNHEKDSKT